MNQNKINFISTILLVFTFTTNAEEQTARDLDWFRDAQFGVFVHFLGGGEQWNDQVNSFDVPHFVKQVQQTGAGYVIFTLGQNSGYYCSPNTVYEKLAGYQPGERCSKRDLPMELADELAKHNIRLMLYLPSRSPQQDPHAMQNLNDVHERQPAPQEFTRKWSEIIREWSLCYGTKVSGWWFDGAYNTEGWDDLDQPFNWDTWAAACRVGNPQSILAFNRGAEIQHAYIKQTDQQDYTAGEQNDIIATPQTHPAPEGLQWHILTFLGSAWSKADGPRFSNPQLIDYVKRIISQDGVVSLDVHVENSGTIYEPHFQQLQAVGNALK